MKKKYIIKLAHPMREMLAEIVRGLADFELADESKPMILSNRKKANSANLQKNVIFERLSSLLHGYIARVQNKLGLINFRIVWEKDCDILVAHGGFLIPNKPYVTYIEKATQLYGYTAKNYDKPLSLFMLRGFLRSNRLKKIFFLSSAAFDGMVNIGSFDNEIRELIKSKGVVIYPPISRFMNSDIERFKNVDGNVRFLYISNNFYGKGGLEVFNAFSMLRKEIPTIRLVVITDLESIEITDYQNMLKSEGVELYDFVFTREELLRKFFGTCHILCYPTYSDSFSSVVNEAISSFMPIITTDFYSIPERVRDGYNGFVCRSPLPNYNEKFVISKEHFTDQPEFHEIIRSYRRNGKLQYVEDFLYKKMRLFSVESGLVYKMAKNSRQFSKDKLDSSIIRGEINRFFSEAISS